MGDMWPPLGMSRRCCEIVDGISILTLNDHMGMVLWLMETLAPGLKIWSYGRLGQPCDHNKSCDYELNAMEER